MSTSITSRQVIKNVAATLLKMQSPGMYTPYIQSMNKAAAEVLNALDPQWKTLQKNEQFPRIYEALINKNIESFKERYPHLVEEYSHALTVPPLSQQEMDNKDFEIPLTGAAGIQGMSFLATSLLEIMHGHEHDAVSDELQQALDSLQRHVCSAIALHARMYEIKALELPSTPQIAESISRLNTNGAFIYGTQEGLNGILPALAAISDNPESAYGREIFLTIYNQIIQRGPVALPINKGETYLEAYRAAEQYSQHRLSGDVPFPTQADSDTLNAAVEYVRSRLPVVPLTDASGKPLEPHQKENVLRTFSRFANNIQINGQDRRISEAQKYINMPYAEAAKKIAERKVPNIDCLLVHQQPLPDIDDNHYRRKDYTENVSALSNLIDKSGGRIIVVAPDSGMTEDQVKQVFPYAQMSHYSLSQQDVDLLRYANIQTHTPVEMVLRQTLFNVFDAHSLTPQVPPQNVHDFAESFIHQLSGRIVGLNDDITDLLKDKIQTQAFRYGLNYLADSIKSTIPPELKSGLSVRSTDNPIPAPDTPAQPELRVARPR